jgi:hypothetical protein
VYKAGDLKLTTEPLFDECDRHGSCVECEGDKHGVLDERDDYALGKGAYLPHACEEWFIGGPEQIKLMIEELQIALSLLEES